MNGRIQRSQTRRARRHRRRGYALVIFALVFFCLMALGALVIDLGLARLTQRQMQSAVDTAALEGLRGRNRTDDGFPDPQRRSNAANFAAWVFDDNFDTASDELNLGAGPRFDLTAGIPVHGESGPFDASALLALSDPPVYDPDLRLNVTENRLDGDMVAGTFNVSAPADSEPGYIRDDFTAAEATTPARETDAFLVRMRRSDELFLPTDEARSNDVPIPYLFGRGSLLATGSKGNGITVRATAIAAARAAKSVGASQVTQRIPGALALGIYLSNWRDSNGLEFTVNVGANGALEPDVGFVTQPDGTSELTNIGDLRSANGLVASPEEFVSAVRASVPQPDNIAYVLILGDSTTPAASHVVGFGCVEITSTLGSEIRFTKLRSRIASANATTTVSRNIVDSVSSMQLASILEQHRQLSLPEVPDDPSTLENEELSTISALLAPALAR